MEQSETITVTAKAGGERSLAAWEIASVFISFLITEWIVLALGGKVLAAIPLIAAFGYILASHRLHGETLRDLGFRMDNFWPALLLLAIPTVVALICFLMIGWSAGGWRFGLIWSRPRYLLLPVWALAQQYVTQGFINRRAQTVFGKGWKSVLITASIFALLHMPNLNLVWLTLVGGIVWAAVYQLRPNLFALAVSHTLTSMILARALPNIWVNSMRVGLKYFL
ncbi:MAG: CPBP family glutamic-type intramembrane protease [Acidobacteriota bacterium]